MFLTPQMAGHTISSGYFYTTAYCWYKFFFSLTAALTVCLWDIHTKTRSHWNIIPWSWGNRLIIHWSWGDRLIKERRVRAASAVTSQLLAHVELLAALARQTSLCFLSTLYAGILTITYIQKNTNEVFNVLTDFWWVLRPFDDAAMKAHNEQRIQDKSCNV